MNEEELKLFQWLVDEANDWYGVCWDMTLNDAEMVRAREILHDYQTRKESYKPATRISCKNPSWPLVAQCYTEEDFYAD